VVQDRFDDVRAGDRVTTTQPELQRPAREALAGVLDGGRGALGGERWAGSASAQPELSIDSVRPST